MNDTVPLSSSPGHAAREERKMVSFGCFFFLKRISSLSLDHTPHQPEAPRPGPPTKAIGRPAIHPAESKGAAHCCRGWWPTSRRETRSPSALMKGPAPFHSYKYRTKKLKQGGKRRRETRKKREPRGEKTKKKQRKKKKQTGRREGREEKRKEDQNIGRGRKS